MYFPLGSGYIGPLPVVVQKTLHAGSVGPTTLNEFLPLPRGGQYEQQCVVFAVIVGTILPMVVITVVFGWFSKFVLPLVVVTGQEVSTLSVKYKDNATAYVVTPTIIPRTANVVAYLACRLDLV